MTKENIEISHLKGEVNQATSGSINITYYTDPLCCWSWAFELSWQQLLIDFKNDISYRYCMGGLLPDWKNFHDEFSSISRPAQMGPLWMQAGIASGRYIYDRIWIEDPPASSYPACIAVKCAQLQSFTAGETYLQHVRQAVMTNGINVAKQQALLDIAEQVADTTAILDVRKFKEDLFNGNGLALFTQDVHEVQYKRIGRFPSLLITALGKQALLYNGYKPYADLKNIIADMLNVQHLITDTI